MILIGALILDAIFGEPEAIWARLPHPAILMGRAVGFLENRLNQGETRRAAGVLAVALLVLGAVALGLLIRELPLGWLWEMLLAAVLLAQKSLVQHVRAVATGLGVGLAEGRGAVAMIVGRETAALDRAGVARAAIESAAENLSDGVVAPVFWFLVAGLPGMLAYKVINTADSMIGYRTPRLEAFGWAAARTDDLANWVPARLTALLILLAHGRMALWAQVRRDAALHRSPNAGWPEAAMAPLIGVALAGPRTYEGRAQDFAWVHPEGRKEADIPDIEAAIQALWRVWAWLLALAVIWAVAIWLMSS